MRVRGGSEGLPGVGPAPGVMGKGLRPASLPCCPRLHPINTASQAPPPTPAPSVTQGAVLSCPRHSDWPRELGMHLSGLVHLGVVNEMSCQTDWGVGVEVGGRQSERMNCSCGNSGCSRSSPRGPAELG